MAAKMDDFDSARSLAIFRHGCIAPRARHVNGVMTAWSSDIGPKFEEYEPAGHSWWNRTPV
jgi:hypothetical protein